MGNSIEGAIVFTMVLGLITFLVVGPFEIVVRTIEVEQKYYERVEDYSDNGDIYIESDHVSTSAERLCTILSGISDSYNIIYDGIVNSMNSFSEEGD